MKYGVTYPITHLSGLAPGIPPSDQLVFAKTLKKGVFNSLWARRHFIPTNPKTTRQIDWRDALKLVSGLWKNGGEDPIHMWNVDIAGWYNTKYGTHYNGFELWMKTAMFDAFDNESGYLRNCPPITIQFWEDWLNITGKLDVIPVLGTPEFTWATPDHDINIEVTNYTSFATFQPEFLSARLERTVALSPAQTYGSFFLANGPGADSYSHMEMYTGANKEFSWTIEETFPGEFVAGKHIKLRVTIAARDGDNATPEKFYANYVPLPPMEFDITIPAGV